MIVAVTLRPHAPSQVAAFAQHTTAAAGFRDAAQSRGELAATAELTALLEHLQQFLPTGNGSAWRGWRAGWRLASTICAS